MRSSVRSLVVVAVSGLVALPAGTSLRAQSPPPPSAASETTLPVPLQRADTVYREQSGGAYVRRAVGPLALLRAVAFSGFDQAIDRPEEWTTDWNGYGKRLGTQVAQGVIGQTVLFGLSHAMGQQYEGFSLCDCEDTGARLRHAMLRPFRAKTPEGIRYSLLNPASAVASGLLVSTLHPRGFSVGDGLKGGATNLLTSSLFSAAREFWPWEWRPFGF
ncbi:MAG: hypothetical protein ABI877_15105 [Gemmatimonadaceae bacterium]